MCLISNCEVIIDCIWCIGGKIGWYYGILLWEVWGVLDKMVGGVGLWWGCINVDVIYFGDVFDFWWVFYVDKEEGCLLFFVEMKLLGEVWLEFKMEGDCLI